MNDDGLGLHLLEYSMLMFMLIFPVILDSNMISLVSGLYNGGTESTSVSLYWGFLHLLIYPESQKKIYDEIQQVVGEYYESKN